jgi:hypothetical protein
VPEIRNGRGDAVLEDGLELEQPASFGHAQPAQQGDVRRLAAIADAGSWTHAAAVSVVHCDDV